MLYYKTQTCCHLFILTSQKMWILSFPQFTLTVTIHTYAALYTPVYRAANFHNIHRDNHHDTCANSASCDIQKWVRGNLYWTPLVCLILVNSNLSFMKFQILKKILLSSQVKYSETFLSVKRAVLRCIWTHKYSLVWASVLSTSIMPHRNLVKLFLLSGCFR